VCVVAKVFKTNLICSLRKIHEWLRQLAYRKKQVFCMNYNMLNLNSIIDGCDVGREYGKFLENLQCHVLRLILCNLFKKLFFSPDLCVGNKIWQICRLFIF
jgi:hypothetical protein